MDAMRKLVMALAVMAAVGSGAAFANGDGGRTGSNAAPGSASAASTAEEVQAFFRELDQRTQQPATGSQPRGASPQGAPQQPLVPGAGADASRHGRGANVVGDAVGTGEHPVAPGAGARRGGGAGGPAATQACQRCASI